MNDQFLVPRLEDLPYASSPPIQFTYRQTATLAAGVYPFAVAAPQVLSTIRPLIANSMYYFRSVTVTADVDEGDYLSSITVIPTFQMYLKSTGKQILFREPLTIAKYFQNFDYRLCWITQREDDQLYASITGSLTQTAALIGKASITMSVIISAQEIVDAAYIKRFLENSYPKVGKGD
jgi:hypothetical protein